MSTIDWANLLQQDRCKALGVPWSPEELKAIHEEGVPADYVRAGVKTMAEYREHLQREKVEGKSFSVMSVGELQEEAVKLDLKVHGITPRETLIDLIKQARLLEEAGVDTKDAPLGNAGTEDEDEDDDEDEEDGEEDEDEEEEEDKASVDDASQASEEVKAKAAEEEAKAKETKKNKKKAKKKNKKRKRNRS